ncbi:hypothetical protein [Halorussus halobius]|uniref:hypothetical protein n=1 Tax=Halorussus halobius TaxID=1710537 RepID=UPI0010921E56|nr:hypothetical protein [Halorussus halobius]
MTSNGFGPLSDHAETAINASNTLDALAAARQPASGEPARASPSSDRVALVMTKLFDVRTMRAVTSAVTLALLA